MGVSTKERSRTWDRIQFTQKPIAEKYIMDLRRFLTLSGCAMVFLASQLFAQTNLTVLNFSFEKPDSGKIKGWDGKCSDPTYTGKKMDIPFWNTDALDSADFDSGIEQAGATDGTYRGYLMGADTSMYQITNRRIEDSDTLELAVDAMNTYQAPSFKMELFYMLYDTVRVPIVSEVKTLTSSMAKYTISFATDPNSSPWIGWKLGILFDNVTNPVGTDNLHGGWLGFDNVRLRNLNRASIPVVNYSFEEPDSGKIKGWDGVCTDPTWTGPKAVPGWTGDKDPLDSGVELGWTPRDGQYTAFMRATPDSSVWNMTDYVMQADDLFQLKVDGRATWAATLLRTALFYVNDSGDRVILATQDNPLNVDLTYATYSLLASADANAAGHTLGILLQNASTLSASWAGADNVRVFNLARISAVGSRQVGPSKFALEQNYPNPFNPTTTIQYTVKSTGNVSLKVYDVVGREVANLVDGTQNAGNHEVKFLASNLASGVYFYRLVSPSGTMVKKMMLLK
jgi:Secretion system C-terminal sorting domain